MGKRATSSKNKQQEWSQPVSFYFRVDFQRGSTHFQASFMQISGLDMVISTEEKGSVMKYKMPTGISHSDITLKRPLTSCSDGFTSWVNSWQNWMEGRDGHLEVYDLVIKLLDLKGKPLAGWLCRHAYPIKWQLEALDSVGSALSCETITLAYGSMKRLDII